MRKLTGKWYLKKGFWSYTIMVEVIKTDTCLKDFSQSPEYKVFEKAKSEDIFNLNIPIG